MSLMELAIKYIHDHNNPVLKVQTFGAKLLLANLSEEETVLKDQCLTQIETVLRHERVERRLARSVAEFIPQQNVIKVIKLVGSTIGNYGHQNKNGKFLDHNESLFLLEMNKLDLIHNTIPMSIQEMFKNANFMQYLSYKKLAVHGYRVKNYARESTRQPTTEYEPPVKIAKTSQVDERLNILKELRQNGPQIVEPNSSNLETIFLINNTNNLEKIATPVIMDTNHEFLASNVNNKSAIHTWPTDGSIAFYQFYINCIPVLE